MKYINKGGPPHGYRLWCRTVSGTNKESYTEIPGAIKALVLAALAKEQGDICAYTMRRIGTTTSHIEHIKPESLCRTDQRGSDLDFSNMVACFPRDGMPRDCRYGAQKKGNWWDAKVFVSPLKSSCEKKFRFAMSGAISAVGGNEAAIKTIAVLGLDNGSLTEDRRRAIEELIYGNGSDPLSKAKAARLRSAICLKSGGRYIEFCVALRDALDDYLKYVDRLAKQRKFSRARKR